MFENSSSSSESTIHLLSKKTSPKTLNINSEKIIQNYSTSDNLKGLRFFVKSNKKCINSSKVFFFIFY